MGLPFAALDSRPKYQQVAADLEQRVRSGEYGPGEPLPSLAELGERYAVSAITVRQAVRILVDRGLAQTVPRKGIFAAGGTAPAAGADPDRVGIVLPGLRFWTDLYLALVEELHALGLRVQLNPVPARGPFPAQLQQARREFHGVQAQCGAGMIMLGDRFLVESFQQARRPGQVAVCLENVNGVPASVPLATTDNFGGIFAATRHLIELGHRRIAYLDQDLLVSPEPEEVRPGTTHEQRYAGYRAALRGAALAPCFPAEWLRALTGPAPSPEHAARLRQPEMPTAVVCFNDSHARRAAAHLAAAGIALPGEVSLTGYDNDAEPDREPWLTSLDQNAPELARQLARLVFSELDRGPDRRGEAAPRILVPPVLHLRGSVAPPP